MEQNTSQISVSVEKATNGQSHTKLIVPNTSATEQTSHNSLVKVSNGQFYASTTILTQRKTNITEHDQRPNLHLRVYAKLGYYFSNPVYLNSILYLLTSSLVLLTSLAYFRITHNVHGKGKNYYTLLDTFRSESYTIQDATNQYHFDYQYEQFKTGSITRLALEQDLHDLFYIPYGLMETWKDLTIFQCHQQLVQAQRYYDNHVPRIFIAHLHHTFAERVIALGFAMAYAKSTDRLLLVIWEKNHKFMFDWDEVFYPQHSFIVLETSEAPKFWPPKVIDDLAHLHIIYFDESEKAIDRSAETSILDSVLRLEKSIYIKFKDIPKSTYAPQDLQQEMLELIAPKPMTEKTYFKITVIGSHKNISVETLRNELHDEYQIPFVFIDSMSVSMQKRLLRKLWSVDATLLAEGVKDVQARVFFIHAQYGLGNRMRALASALCYAQKTYMVLVVIWELDHHLTGFFGDFFVNDFVVVDKLSDKWPFQEQASVDKAFVNVDVYNLMKKENPAITRASSFHLKRKLTQHVYIKTAYVIKSKETGTDSVKDSRTSPISVALKQLIAHASIQKVVEFQDMDRLDGMVGVHIRGQKVEDEKMNISTAAEYTEHGRDVTNYWRKVTRASAFLTKMSQYPKEQLFYVAADTMKSIQELERNFPGRIFFTARNCEDRGAECLRYALVDILCLSRTKHILGSHWSSFTEAAVRMGNGTVYIAGVDFSRVSKPLNINKPTESPRKSPDLEKMS